MQTERNLLATISCDGNRALVRMFWSYFTDYSENFNEARHEMIQMSNFVYVFSCGAITLQAEKRSSFVMFLDDGWRVVQQPGTIESFYGSTQWQYGSIPDTKKRQADNKKSLGRPKIISVWFEKAPAFKTALSDIFKNNVCRLHRKKFRVKCAYNRKKKLRFVRWNGVVSKQLPKVKTFVETSARIRIFW